MKSIGDYPHIILRSGEAVGGIWWLQTFATPESVSGLASRWVGWVKCGPGEYWEAEGGWISTTEQRWIRAPLCSGPSLAQTRKQVDYILARLGDNISGSRIGSLMVDGDAASWRECLEMWPHLLPAWLHVVIVETSEVTP